MNNFTAKRAMIETKIESSDEYQEEDDDDLPDLVDLNGSCTTNPQIQVAKDEFAAVKRENEAGHAFVNDAKCHDDEENCEYVLDPNLALDGLIPAGIPPQLYAKLFPHQRRGVAWMLSQDKGGILADDMGLGKTIQTITAVCSQFNTKTITKALIIMPLSVIPTWRAELYKYFPEIPVLSMHGLDAKSRKYKLSSHFLKPGICLSNYDAIRRNPELYEVIYGKKIVWDYIVLDEGHKIRINKTQTFQSLKRLTANKKFILTGTALQNNIKELWTLFSFIYDNSLLGPYKIFNQAYEAPIVRSRTSGASAREIRFGQEMATSLKKIIQPYYLRRTKAELSQSPDFKMMADVRKNDIVCWVYINRLQQQLYTNFLQTESVKEVFMKEKSALLALNVLKKICDHPRLLNYEKIEEIQLDGYNNESMDWINRMMKMGCEERNIVTGDTLLSESAKLDFLGQLVQLLFKNGNRTLIFSRSTKILNMIECVLFQNSYRFIRLDGSVTGIDNREKLLMQFENDHSIKFFLLTTQVGGVGLTITSADRVIIYDPSWNPASDDQAVDRVYRYGQQKNVVIYRLVTCGTVEEKIYRRQIFKKSLFKIAACKSKNPLRYFTKEQIYQLFSLGDLLESETKKLIDKLHKGERVSDEQFDAHLKDLEELNIYGISDHNCLFSRDDMESGCQLDDDIEQSIKRAEKILQDNISYYQNEDDPDKAIVDELKTSIADLKAMKVSGEFDINKFEEDLDRNNPNLNDSFNDKSDQERDDLNDDSEKENFYQQKLGSSDLYKLEEISD